MSEQTTPKSCLSFNRGPVNPPGTPKPGTPEFEAAAKQVEEEMRRSGARGGGILQELLGDSKRTAPGSD